MKKNVDTFGKYLSSIEFHSKIHIRMRAHLQYKKKILMRTNKRANWNNVNKIGKLC